VDGGPRLAFRRGSGRRRRFVVVIVVIVIVLVSRLALSLPLLAKVVDDLLQPFARVRFAVSRGHHAASRVDGKVFVQIALLIQRLRLQYHPCRARGTADVERNSVELRGTRGRGRGEKGLAWLRFCIFWIIGNRSSSTLDWLHPSSCKRKLRVFAVISSDVIVPQLKCAYSRSPSRSGSPHLNGSSESSTVGW
jgi:hypothetical protein